MTLDAPADTPPGTPEMVVPSPPPPPVGPPRDTLPPAAIVSTPSQTPAPRPRARLGLILGVALGGTAVLLIAVIAVVLSVLGAQRAPSVSIDRFLTALEKGHAATAVAQLSPAPTTSTALADDTVYDHVSDRITKHRILSTTTHGSRSVVTARLTTQKGSFTQTFTLVTRKKAFIWDVWTVDGTSFPVIRLTDTRPKALNVTVNGVAIQKNGSEFDAFLALPGTYTFAVDGDTSLVTADSHSVAIGSFEGDKSVTLQPRLTNDGVAQARAAVDAFLDACIAQSVLAPVGNCGFEIINDDPDVSIDSISWSMKQRPVVEFGAWHDGVWQVKTDTAGSFEMNALGHLGSAHGEVDGLIDDYDVQGYVSFDESGHLVFTSDYKGDDANTPNA